MSDFRVTWTDNGDKVQEMEVKDVTHIGGVNEPTFSWKCLSGSGTVEFQVKNNPAFTVEVNPSGGAPVPMMVSLERV